MNVSTMTTKALHTALEGLRSGLAAHRQNVAGLESNIVKASTTAIMREGEHRGGRAADLAADLTKGAEMTAMGLRDMEERLASIEAELARRLPQEDPRSTGGLV